MHNVQHTAKVKAYNDKRSPVRLIHRGAAACTCIMKRICGFDYFACLEVNNFQLFPEKWKEYMLAVPMHKLFMVRSQNSEKRLFASSCLFVWNPASTGRIFMKFGI